MRLQLLAGEVAAAHDPLQKVVVETGGWAGGESSLNEQTWSLIGNNELTLA